MVRERQEEQREAVILRISRILAIPSVSAWLKSLAPPLECESSALFKSSKRSQSALVDGQELGESSLGDSEKKCSMCVCVCVIKWE